MHHLADQLRSKRKELSLLRHQQKKQKMEKLRAKESSMNKQIEVPIEYCFKKSHSVSEICKVRVYSNGMLVSIG